MHVQSVRENVPTALNRKDTVTLKLSIRYPAPDEEFVAFK